MKRLLTLKQEQKVISLYLDCKWPCSRIGNYFNVNGEVIRTSLIRNKVSLRSKTISNRKYSLNENYFQYIDTEDKAYWLGFILADGNIYENKLSIGLSIKDKNHLVKFKQSINSGHKIGTHTITRDNGKIQIFSTLSFRSDKLRDDLFRLGITPQKSLTVTPPNISINLQHHFWRGCIDGDGTIFTGGLGNGPYVCVRGSFNTCVCFSEWLKQNLGFIKNPYKIPSLYKITITGRLQVIKLLNLLYEDATIFLDRKKDKAVKLLNGYKGYIGKN